MKTRQKLRFLVFAALLISLLIAAGPTVSADGEGRNLMGPVGFETGHISRYSEDAEFVPGEVIVGLKGAGSASQLAALVDGRVVASIDALNAHLVTLPSADWAAVEGAIATLEASEQVAWAEPNYVGHIAVVPNDVHRLKQWALPAARLNMYNAWNVTTGSTAASKAIAILDTGADMDHPDLDAKLLTAADWDFVNNDANPQDDHNHGSHVAGIAAAETNNTIGIAGVAWNNKIIALKVCNAAGACTTWDTAQGIVHATMKKATVISMSLSWDTPSAVQRAACDFAWRGNVVVVAAAGNTNTFEARYPAAFDSVVSVASTNYFDTKSSFSTYHNTVEVSAPGGTHPGPAFQDILSCNMSGGYMWMQGTSMSTPQVAGAVALYRSKYPTAPVTRVRHCLHVGVDDKGTPGWDMNYGWGRLDVYKFLNCKTPVGKNVLIDNTHSNINYSASSFKYARFEGFANDLLAQGYNVSWTSDVGLSATALNKNTTLILADPETSYTAGERSAITNWIRNRASRKLVALCEWYPFSDNAELNQLLSQIGSGIQCAPKSVTEASQYDFYNFWPVFTNFNRTYERVNTSVWYAGNYAGTYLTFSGMGPVWLAKTTSNATASVANVVGFEPDSEGPLLESQGGKLEISDVDAGPFVVAAYSKVGTMRGRVIVFSDTDFVGRIYSNRYNNRLWIDNVLGWW